MKMVYATIIRNKRQVGRTYKIRKDLFQELLDDKKHYTVRNKEQLGDVIVYDILHTNDDGTKSIIIISEEI